ncbi:MAG: hypothetical protein WBB29_11830 [Geitlerinemataceae cyanobacterium]
MKIRLPFFSGRLAISTDKPTLKSIFPENAMEMPLKDESTSLPPAHWKTRGVQTAAPLLGCPKTRQFRAFRRAFQSA